MLPVRERAFTFSLSIFGIPSPVDSLLLPLLFGLVGNSPVPLPAEYFSVSSSWLYSCVWVAFLYSGNLWSSLYYDLLCPLDFPDSSDSKNSACESAGDPGSIPKLGRSPGEGNGYPLQYSCLENAMDRGA